MKVTVGVDFAGLGLWELAITRLLPGRARLAFMSKSTDWQRLRLQQRQAAEIILASPLLTGDKVSVDVYLASPHCVSTSAATSQSNLQVCVDKARPAAYQAPLNRGRHGLDFCFGNLLKDPTVEGTD